MTLLSAAQLLSPVLPSRDVNLPELGGTVRIRQMSARVRTDYWARVGAYQDAKFAYDDDQKLPAKKRKGLEEPAYLDHIALAIALSVTNETGGLIYDPENTAPIGELPASAVSRIWEAVQDVNLGNQAAVPQVEAAKKN